MVLESLISLLNAKLLQSCPNLCNPMDCSLPGSSVYGVSQARILEWVAILLQKIFPSQGSNPGLLVSPALAGEFFTISTTWKASINLLSSAFLKTSTAALFIRLCSHRTFCKVLSCCLSLEIVVSYYLSSQTIEVTKVCLRSSCI